MLQSTVLFFIRASYFRFILNLFSFYFGMSDFWRIFEALNHNQNKNNDMELRKKQSEFKDEKHYLIALAVAYIKEHTGFVGIDDSIIEYDDSEKIESDGYWLADCLQNEFDLSDEDVETK